jgi:transposase-like protein
LVPHGSLEPEDAGAGQSGGRDARSLTARGATAASGAEHGLRERRFSAVKKAEVALRLMRGEALDALSRELGVTAATLSAWRDAFLSGGEAALKSRQTPAQDDEILHLKAMIGDLAMRNELLLERARLAEAASPFPWRRSRG